MRIRSLRNATLVIEAAGQRVLVDPMLGPPGSLPPYSFLRFKPQRNPLVALPPDAHGWLQPLTAGLITHTHYGLNSDHLDAAGASVLRDARVPVYCHAPDERTLRARGLPAVPMHVGQEHEFFDGSILPVPAAHGRGFVRRLMGPGVGYVIRLPDEPRLYLTGDSVLTDHVRETLAVHQPDVCVLACGGAQLDLGGPVLMSLKEILEFVSLTPGLVFANHMGALNHCPITRDRLAAELAQAGLAERVRIPADGELVEFPAGRGPTERGPG